MSRFLKSAVAALAFYGISTPAHAVVLFDVGPAPEYAGTPVTFDDVALGTNSGTFSMPAGTFTLTNNSMIAQGNTSWNKKPHDDNTQYALIVTSNGSGAGSVDFNLNGGYHYMGLLWGSVNSENMLFFYKDANLLGFVSGAQVIAAAGLTEGNAGINGTAHVNITSEWAFNKVVASSSTTPFEFDDVRFSVVPLPAALSMFLPLIMGGGIYGRRRRAMMAA